jgi:hypothetical protein
MLPASSDVYRRDRQEQNPRVTMPRRSTVSICIARAREMLHILAITQVIWRMPA